MKKALLKFLFVCLSLLLCGMVFFSQGKESFLSKELSSLSPDCKSIGPCASVFQAGEGTARDIHALCQSVMNQDICQGVPEKYRFQCGGGDQELKSTDALAFFKSCGVGFYESGADILSFLWGVMKYALHPPEAVRGMARGWESEAAQSARLYLSSEYEKALNEATGPAKSVKAVGSVSGAVFAQLFDAIYNFLYREVEEFKCMNMAGRMNMMCYLAVDFLIPPVAAIAFLKQGKVPGKVAEFLNQDKITRGKEVSPDKAPGQVTEFLDQSKKVPPPPQVLSRVKVPRALETEAGLKAKGFGDAHIAGMDEMHRMEAIADALRTNRVDPNMTHIEDFAAQVEDHIAFFKRSGRSEEAIERLAREARGRVQEGKVTYNWWMQWNAEMVRAVNKTPGFLEKPFSYIDKFFDKGEDSILKMQRGDFRTNPFGPDEVIFLPTTKELGVMAFNQSSSKKLLPLGLTDQIMEVDGLKTAPAGFLNHDFGHGIDKSRKILLDNKEYKDFYQSFREKVKDLPQDRREKVELALFLYTHEYPGFIKSVSQFTDLSDRPLNLRFFNKSDLGRYLPSSLRDARSHLSRKDYTKSVNHYYKSMLKEFETIARDIQKGR